MLYSAVLYSALFMLSAAPLCVIHPFSPVMATQRSEIHASDSHRYITHLVSAGLPFAVHSLLSHDSLMTPVVLVHPGSLVSPHVVYFRRSLFLLTLGAATGILCSWYLRITKSARWMETDVRHGGRPFNELIINTAHHSSVSQAHNVSYRIDSNKVNLVMQSSNAKQLFSR
jgi:hypothetical protein